MLLELASALSAPVADKTQRFVHLSLNSTLQLINGILSDLQKLLRQIHGTAIVVFLTIPFTSSSIAFLNNLAFNLKD